MTEQFDKLFEDIERFEEEVYPDVHPDYEKAIGRAFAPSGRAHC